MMEAEALRAASDSEGVPPLTAPWPPQNKPRDAEQHHGDSKKSDSLQPSGSRRHQRHMHRRHAAHERTRAASFSGAENLQRYGIDVDSLPHKVLSETRWPPPRRER